MAKRMLVDSTQGEETRVAVVDGNRLEELDFETSSKKQLKGNLYLARVTRIEPSLQAAFVDYGGNRHGFLAFSEIHPDYYCISPEDRDALLASQEDLVGEMDEANVPALQDQEDADQADVKAKETPSSKTEPKEQASEEEAEADKAPVEGKEDSVETEAAPKKRQPRQRARQYSRNRRPKDKKPTAAVEAETPSETEQSVETASAAATEEKEQPKIILDLSSEEHHDVDATGQAQSLEAFLETALTPSDVVTEKDASQEASAKAEEKTAETETETETKTEETSKPMKLETDEEPSSSLSVEIPEASETENSSTEKKENAEENTSSEEVSKETNTSEDEKSEEEQKPRRRSNRRRPRNTRRKKDRSENKQSDKSKETGKEANSEESVESLAGADDIEDDARSSLNRRRQLMRDYKIQDVIKRRQILLIQVNKEERGNKGAALTTYLSLPGRYCVLMPNAIGRAGGISRKISNPADRKRLKELLSSLDVPEGMAVILRTAGVERTKQEIKRDLEYLLRLWDSIRQHAFKSSAPELIYEEANLIKRSIRDLYSKDIDEVLVDGERGYRAAKNFMRMLMPSHARRVQRYENKDLSLFQRYQVENQIEAIHSRTAQLKSGGYLVIDATEALVAVDVNSGKATKESNIEETAYKTNLEAAEELARQIRLRDLAGLIVVDFIDMEDPKHIAAIERKMKEAMKQDRARIQIGKISLFGLLEMSRQRMRPSLQEINYTPCPHCQGLGHVRSIESSALHILRAIEDEALRNRTNELTVFTSNDVAIYLLNQKRKQMMLLEDKYNMMINVEMDDTLPRPTYRFDRSKVQRNTSQDHGSIDTDRIFAATDRAISREENRKKGKDDQTSDADQKQKKTAQRKSASEEKSAEVESSSEDDDTSKNAKNKSRRRGRRGGRRRNNKTSSEEMTASEATTTDVEKDASEEAASPKKEPKKPTRSRKEKTVKEATPETTAPSASTETKENASKSSESTASESTDKTSKTPEKSEDAAPVNEVVNEKPETPKKGWWKKLVG